MEIASTLSHQVLPRSANELPLSTQTDNAGTFLRKK
jgi:hypothetical protein